VPLAIGLVSILSSLVKSGKRLGDRIVKMLRLNRRLRFAVPVLLIILLVVVLADFLAPYTASEQDREHFLAPPTQLHFRNAQQQWQLRPSVFQSSLTDRTMMIYQEQVEQAYPIRFFVEGESYLLLGLIPSRTHLFGVDAPAKLYLAGTDALGRDVFSRLMIGTRLSLAIALGALALSIPFALLFGSVAGYYGGRVDFVCMRFVELFMALPALYLVIALRSALPLSVTPEGMAVALVGVLALFGWAALARIIRGMVLSLRQTLFIDAAIALGANDWRVVTRHLLPQMTGFTLIQAALAAPGFILAEVTLSYLGLGVQEPASSWGSMLAGAKDLQLMLSYWWNLAPAAAIMLVSLTCNLLAEGLREWTNPRSGQVTPLREAF
jgi:peptide/nickel transport system permease protein